MIQYKGKDYQELNFNECVEFEKELLQKVLAASRANMGDELIHQLNVFIDLLRDQKQESIRNEMNKKTDEKDDGIVLDTAPPELEIIQKEPEPERYLAQRKPTDHKPSITKLELSKEEKAKIAKSYL
jgi:hypothetical protein|tara:strand:- start:6002 stop:6382 length:381 start_codon:yes stop_codon:yes gene_type:complete